MNDKVLNIHHNLILSAFTVMGDVLICIALYCMFCKVSGHILEDDFMQSVVVVAAIYFSCVINGGVILYKRNVKDFQVPLLVLRNIIVFTIASVILLKIGGFYLLPLNLSVLFLLSQLIVASTFRLTIRRIVKAYRTKEEHKHHAVLLGSKENIRALYDEMVSVPYFGYAVEGYFDYERASNMPESCPYLGTPDDVVGYLQKHSEVHELYCCLTSRHKDDIIPIIHYCVNHLVHFYSVPNVSNYLHHRMYFNMLGNVPYLSLYRDPLEKVENRAIKRTFDILFSLAFLCTIFPIVFVIVFIITKLTMPGPVFFRQKRNGINGEEFYCIKFRSMRVNAQADTLQGRPAEDQMGQHNAQDKHRRTAAVHQRAQGRHEHRGAQAAHAEAHRRILEADRQVHDAPLCEARDYRLEPGDGLPRRDERALPDGRTRQGRHLLHRALEHLARHLHHLQDRRQCDKRRRRSILKAKRPT